MTPLRFRSAAVAESVGFDYLATDAHYRSLARRIVTALGGERGVVLVTSEPPASPLLISEAINGEASARFSVIGVSGGPEITCDGLARAVPALAARSAALFVLDEADRLSDAQIEEVYEAVLHGDRTVAAAVLLARPGFLARLERPGLHFLQDGSVAHLDFQQLGPDEIGPFLRHEFRLPADAALLSPESLSAIAGATRGDPAMVSRLARRLLQDSSAKSAAPITLAPAESRPDRIDVEAVETASTADATPKPVEETSADDPEPAADAATTEPAAADEPRPSDAVILGSLGEISRAITDAAGESADTAREPDLGSKELTASLLNQPVDSAVTSAPSPAAAETRPAAAQARARRIRLAVLICAAYLAVVGAASVIVFALLHPASPTHVAETKDDVGSLLAKAKESLGDKPGGDRAVSVKPPPAAPAAADDKPATPPSLPPVTAEALPTPSLAPSQSPAPASAPEEKAAAAARAADAPPAKPAPADAAAAPAGDAAVAEAAPPPLPPALPGESSTAAAEAPASAAPTPASKPPVPAAETKTADAAPSKPVAPPASPAAPPTSAPAPAASTPAPAPAAAAPAKPSLSPAEIAELKARGDALLNTGDIVSARLFYERAGEAGDAQAALLAGETFDPAVLLRAGVRGVRGDAAQAAAWYRRASALGSDEAGRRLKSFGK